MAKLTLWLTKTKTLALEQTAFEHPALGTELKAVRGKTSGAFQGYNSFQWTPAVQSMVILALRTMALGRQGRLMEAVLRGSSGSPASSLDYSIGKGPAWLLDVFGVDRSGLPLAKRIFRRTNPERKRDGPVAVAFNENSLSYREITVYLNGAIVDDANNLLVLANEIHEQFIAYKEKHQTTFSSSRHSKILRLGKKSPASSINCPCCGTPLTVSFSAAQAA